MIQALDFCFCIFSLHPCLNTNYKNEENLKNLKRVLSIFKSLRFYILTTKCYNVIALTILIINNLVVFPKLKDII